MNTVKELQAEIKRLTEENKLFYSKLSRTEKTVIDIKAALKDGFDIPVMRKIDEIAEKNFASHNYTRVLWYKVKNGDKY